MNHLEGRLIGVLNSEVRLIISPLITVQKYSCCLGAAFYAETTLLTTTSWLASKFKSK